MAWFDEDVLPTPPVDIDRVVAALEKAGYDIGRIPDEPLAGADFNDIPILFDLARPQFMRVHATPNIVIDEAGYKAALGFCNTWNADSLWGTAYLHKDKESGQTKFCVDVSTLIDPGLSDEQLDILLDLSLTVVIECVNKYGEQKVSGE